MRRRGLAPEERFERSARFWARAYPRRWREIHGEELLAVQRDVALAAAEATGKPAPDRLPPEEIRSLLRAGWGLRLRERPPLWRWVLYRFGLRLPARYWWWVADDIRGAFYSVRDALWGMVLIYGGMTAGLAVYAVVVGRQVTDVVPPIYATWFFWGVVGAVVMMAATFQREYRTRTAWYRHVVYGNVPEQMRSVAVAPAPRGAGPTS
ncbi:hypothetical protein H9623_15435 [Oerskovia sp. Sa1BUA8]|uniref:Uncharacterized protein n=1 Tax=Oerskovia douganii TaxID=2762210 RepID=A0A9D5UB80_9CELL|nr:hypothetical protein [Oerskovia douganii]MBE7701685.1 hypothetical protein [Oerskovia douganii]